jgi:hypothetical protein
VVDLEEARVVGLAVWLRSIADHLAAGAIMPIQLPVSLVNISRALTMMRHDPCTVLPRPSRPVPSHTQAAMEAAAASSGAQDGGDPGSGAGDALAALLKQWGNSSGAAADSPAGIGIAVGGLQSGTGGIKAVYPGEAEGVGEGGGRGYSELGGAGMPVEVVASRSATPAPSSSSFSVGSQPLLPGFLLGPGAPLGGPALQPALSGSGVMAPQGACCPVCACCLCCHVRFLPHGGRGDQDLCLWFGHPRPNDVVVCFFVRCWGWVYMGARTDKATGCLST